MNMKTLYDVPWAQPDALWRKACRIVEKGGYATLQRDGELVQRAVRCIRQLDRALTDRAVRRAAMEYPEVYWALKLHEENSRRVLELKARTLAGQSDDELAFLLGLPRRTVTTFLALFFDVRPRLRAGSWIRHIAIGVPVDQPPSLESLLLLHAWHRGPSVIEPWFDYLDHQEERHDLGTELGLQRAWMEHLIRVQQLPFDAQCLRTLWKLSPFFLAKPPEVVRSTTARTTFLENRARILAEFTWREPEETEFEGAEIPAAAKQVASKGEEMKLSLVG